MRTKTLCYDGQEFKIAPLTVDQSDELTSLAPIDPEKMSPKEVTTFARGRAYKIVPWGLNNAHANGEPAWDELRCRKELDEWLLYKLMNEILAFTHMEPVPDKSATLQ
jgi:hypothetical protein